MLIQNIKTIENVLICLVINVSSLENVVFIRQKQHEFGYMPSFQDTQLDLTFDLDCPSVKNTRDPDWEAVICRED